SPFRLILAAKRLTSVSSPHVLVRHPPLSRSRIAIRFSPTHILFFPALCRHTITRSTYPPTYFRTASRHFISTGRCRSHASVKVNSRFLKSAEPSYSPLTANANRPTTTTTSTARTFDRCEYSASNHGNSSCYSRRKPNTTDVAKPAATAGSSP